jgi:hypothetical protein
MLGCCWLGGTDYIDQYPDVWLDIRLRNGRLDPYAGVWIRACVHSVTPVTPSTWDSKLGRALSSATQQTRRNPHCEGI